MNIDYICDTPDCMFWSEDGCKKETAVTIQEHHCVDYEERLPAGDVPSEDHTFLHLGSFKAPDDWAAYKREREIKKERIELLEMQLGQSEKENRRYQRLFPILFLASYAFGVVIGCLRS